MTYGKLYDNRTFSAKINDKIYSFMCATQNTNTGFRHLCFYQGAQISKAVYYNRTWERFEYETVLNTAINKLKISEAERDLLKLQLIDRTAEESRIKAESIYNNFIEVWNKTPDSIKAKYKNVELYSLEQAESLTNSLKMLNIIKESRV